MNAIDILGLSRNKRTYPQFLNAAVLKSVNNFGWQSQSKIHFKYCILTGAKYTLTSAGLPGLELSVPTKTIYTSRVDIPFVIGDSIEIEGELWTVKDVEKSYDNKSAQMTGDGTKGWILYLNGGKGNG